MSAGPAQPVGAPVLDDLVERAEATSRRLAELLVRVENGELRAELLDLRSRMDAHVASLRTLRFAHRP